MPLTRLLALGVGVCTAVALSVPVAASASPAGPSSGHSAGGSLVLVGGALADDNAAIYGEIVRLAGGPGRARIGIVTAGAPVPAEDPDAGTPDCNNSVCNGAYYAELFEGFGAVAEWIPIDNDHPRAADDPAVVARVEQMTGFFFGGGDQYRYVTTMTRGSAQRDSAALAVIRRKLRAGAVVAGTSAGAQIMAGRDMITGGYSHDALTDGAKPGYFEDPDVLGYLPKGGFGFFTAGLLDTHFSRRGREARSIRLAADTRNPRVFGLDENTALVVTGVGSRREALRVVGEHGVSVLDLRRARVIDTDAGWSVDGVRWSRLTDGDRYRADRWQLVPATDKSRLAAAPGTCPVEPSDDVFYDYAMVELAEGLAAHAGCASVSGTSYEDDPTFEAVLTRGAGHVAYRADGRVSFSGVRVALRPAA